MTNESCNSIVNPERISSLLKEANDELQAILPEIEYLEECIVKLKELKEKKHKLNSLIINLKSLDIDIDAKSTSVNKAVIGNKNTVIQKPISNVNKISLDINGRRKIFIPEVALNNVKSYLRQKNNINFEIYKAVVFNTGEATTEEIKHYLVKNKVKQRKNGMGFDDVPLKEISSRVNYLVRKKLLVSYAAGVFSTVFGWQEAD